MLDNISQIINLVDKTHQVEIYKIEGNYLIINFKEDLLDYSLEVMEHNLIDLNCKFEKIDDRTAKLNLKY